MKYKMNLIKAYLSEIGRRGGKKSRRVLTSEQARMMAAARWLRARERLDGIGEAMADLREAIANNQLRGGKR